MLTAYTVQKDRLRPQSTVMDPFSEYVIAVKKAYRRLLGAALIVSLIASTTTKTGLRVRSKIDTGSYPQGVAVNDQKMATINLEPDAFHGDWNYTIHPT